MKEDLSISSKRIWEIDFLRGFAVVGMVIFHFYYLLNYFNIGEYSLFSGAWKTVGDIVRHTFFGLVGVGLVLSWQRSKANNKPILAYYKRQIARSFILILLGLFISGITFFVDPQRAVVFGVLSFIGLGSLLVLPFVSQFWALGILSLLVLLIEEKFGQSYSNDSLFSYIFGFYPKHVPRFDYFGIVPWVASIFAGGALAHGIFAGAERKYTFLYNRTKSLSPIIWIGKKALLIYFIHLPILFIFVWTFVQITQILG